MSLLDRAKNGSTPWYAAPGDGIEGKVLELSEGSSDYGDYPIVVLEVTEGTEKADKEDEAGGIQIPAGEIRAVHARRSVFKDQVVKAGVSVGDNVACFYAGPVTSKAGHEYHSYKVLKEAAAPGDFTPVPATVSASNTDDDEEF